MKFKRAFVNSWEEAAELVKRRALASSDGEAHIIVRLVEMNVETDDGDVHDVYEGLIRYYADEELNGKELVEIIRKRYRDNEEYVKEYKTERGVHNYMKRSEKVPYLDGIIVQ